VTVVVDRGRLELFAKATGQTDPLYTDPAAAQALGHPDLPVPPTYLFALELAQPDPFGWITSLGVDLNSVLHGSESFDYRAMAYAGQELTARSTITDVYSKRGGALEFIERRTDITRADETVAVLAETIIVRNGASA
jgi:acyl dehydratase